MPLGRPGIVGLTLALAVLSFNRNTAADAPASFPRFRGEEIDKSLKVGYAVKLVDLNDDGKKDIIVVDSARIVWFENPTWKLHTIIQGQTKPDNVCIDAHDIDGDGQLDLALGADWKPFNTKEGGTLQWLKRGKSIDDPWTVYPIDTEPTVHRIYFADIDGNGKTRLILGPLMGRNSTKEKNWSETPVRVLAYKIPKDPAKDRWVPEVLDESRHVMHNFWPVDLDGNKELDILTASYEGLSLLTRASGQWTCQLLGQGNQDKPDGNRGCSEVKLGRLKNGRPYVATIEPWHGHQVVVYTPPAPPSPCPLPRGGEGGGEGGLWTRQVIDDQLKWGHAVWCADLDGDGDEELIIGVRDPLNDKVRYGVNVYKATDAKATKWQKHVVENGGVAVEDLAAADLNGDGRVDIVAVGRATGNVKIYWNEGPPK